MLDFIPPRLRQSVDRFLENELFRRVVKNSGYLFSTTGVSAVLSMIQGILAARILGVEGFGVLGTITMFTSVVNKFASFRMGELVVKYVGKYSESDDQERAAAIFKLSLFIETLASFFAFGLVTILAPIGARYFAKDPGMTNYFMIYGTIILANLVGESSNGLLQIYDRFRRIAGINLIQSIATLSLIIVVVILDGNMLGIILAYMAGKFVGAAGLTISAILEASHRWGSRWWVVPLSPLRNQARELANFAISTNISASISLITKDSEILWVSLLRNPLEAGYYKLALALANIVQMPISPMPQATYPEIARQAAKDKWENMRYILRQGSYLAGGYTLIATISLAIFGPLLIQYIYGAEYLPAYSALLILLTGLLFANTFYWRRVALLTLGRPDFPAKLNLLLAVVKIIGILIFVPQYGYLASAAMLASFYIIGSIISVIKIRSLMSSRIQA